jgi:hypothetical protein
LTLDTFQLLRGWLKEVGVRVRVRLQTHGLSTSRSTIGTCLK